MSDKQKLFFMKEPARCSDTRRLHAVKLQHPRTGQPAAFLLEKLETGGGTLLEVQVLDSGPRCWVVGSSIEPDGEVYVCTPVDPLFLVLPQICNNQYAQQLDHILENHEFPDTAKLSAVVSLERLALIAERKGDADLKAYKYSEDKTLAWLERKVRRLVKVLESRGIHGNTGKSEHFVKVGPQEIDKDAYLKYAWGIISDYLSGDLSALLRQRLKLPDERPKRPELTPEKTSAKKQRGTPLQPLEDYSSLTTKNKQDATPKTAKQKALAKSAVGTKSITSFFTKK